MAVFRDLKSLMELAVKWENRMTGFYEQAENVITLEGCKHVLAMLKENHELNLKVIAGIKIDDFGSDEWIRSSADIDIESILSLENIDMETPGCEIARQISELEGKIRDFYRSIALEIVTAEEKELFESLVVFKEKQIFEIKRCVDDHKLYEGHKK